MEYTREQVVEKLLASYRNNYNIDRIEAADTPLAAVCSYFEQTEKYVLSRKANLWTTQREEFVYVYSFEQLTGAEVSRCLETVIEEGMKKVHPGPDHMSSNLVALFVCDGCTEDAVAAVKKSRFHKSFKFSLHGWTDLEVQLIRTADSLVEANAMGRHGVKLLKKILASM